MEQLYRARLPDAFAPSFCSFGRTYYGSKSAIATVLERLDCCPNELDGSNEPQPVQVRGSRQISLADLNDTFKNLWGYDYYFKVHEVKATLIYIQGGDRCVKASMRGITCSSELLPDQTIHIDAGECWGLPIFEQKGEWMESLLYFRERTFDTEEELRLDMSNPAPVNFDGFWEDVFVDG